MAPNPNDILNSDADPLSGQLTFGDVAMLVFAVLASLFAMIVTVAI